MEKLGSFVNTVKDADLFQADSGSGNVKENIIKCLAVVGAFAIGKMVWAPLKSRIFGKAPLKEEQLTHVKNSSQLKEKYGGEWALLTDGTDPTTRKLAIELAREGYNLVLIVRKQGAQEKITSSTSKYGVKVEIIIADNYVQMSSACEEHLREKDLSIVITGLAEASQNTDLREADALALSFGQQVFMSGTILPRLVEH